MIERGWAGTREGELRETLQGGVFGTEHVRLTTRDLFHFES
jgi:hypothetical protein